MAIKKLHGFGKFMFEDKYIYPGEKTWGDRMKVVCKQAASAELDHEKERIEKKFWEVLAPADFVPGGRIIFGAGRNAGKYNLLNCYVLHPDDSVDSIAKTISDMYKISCAGGGVGFNFSRIRPKGDHIQNILNSAPGSVSVMKMINKIGEHVMSGKNRRTALLATLEVTHPDLLDFLTVKLNKEELTNFNISVAITDRFIEAVENNENWYFTFNNKKYFVYEMKRISKNGTDTIKVVAWTEEDAKNRAILHHQKEYNDTFEDIHQVDIKAKDIWKILWVNAVATGCPGIQNISMANSYNNTDYFEYLPASNPCGEIFLPAYGNCCLGHINLANMVIFDDKGNPEVDYRRIAATVRVGVRFLDNILTINHFPIPECREVGHRSRRIGLGVMGLHHMLIRLGLDYGSEESLEFIDRLFETIRNEAYKASVYLARDKSPFPEFDSKKFLKSTFAKTLPARIRMMIKTHGIRNAAILTVAPTGTTSIVMGVSSGIEPMFSPIYKRRYKTGETIAEEVVFDPLFREFVDKNLPLDHFKGAYDITPREHMAVQATIQRYVDNSISKTINMPEETQALDFIDDALSFAPYLKGMTIYRAGSKGNEPLTAIPTTPENIMKYADVDAYVSDATVCSLDGKDCG